MLRSVIVLLACLAVLLSCSRKELPSASTRTPAPTASISSIHTSVPTTTPSSMMVMEEWKRAKELEGANIGLLLIGESGKKKVIYAVENKDAEYSPVWVSWDFGESWIMWGRITPQLRSTKQILLGGITETGEPAFMMPSLPDVHVPLSQPALTTVKEGRIVFTFNPEEKLLALSLDNGESWTKITPPETLQKPAQPIAVAVKGYQVFLFLAANGETVWKKIVHSPP